MNFADYELYPLELSLNRIKKAWGGWPGRIGEIWSLSGPPHESLVLNGPLSGQRLTGIVGEFQQKLLGKDMELDLREPFPMLLKFISAAEDLSVQVHPDDAYTMKNALPMVGNDKIWYIIAVKPGSLIYLGFKDKINKKKTREAVAEKTLHHFMNNINVKPGDLYTIPAGRIHSIGKGVVLFEIQRHSLITFKLFDRQGKDVKKESRKSHIDEALKILDFNPISLKPISGISISSNKNRIEYMALTPHFILRKLIIKGSLDLSSNGNRFMVYTGLRGAGWLRWGFSDIATHIEPYQSILVPAFPEDFYFESKDRLEVIETSVPDLGGETLDQMFKLKITLDKIVGLGGGDYGGILKQYLR